MTQYDKDDVETDDDRKAADKNILIAIFPPIS